ncbi:MAG: sulfotransferase domain-containing protein [Alphaproteobacteria bacterium]|nr:sulfotransferase domain-containing protein [Alphaproteobacteria bacterium]
MTSEHVFILSTGRSGTMTLARLFQGLESVHAVHEAPPELVLEASGYAYGEVSHETVREIVRESRQAPEGKTYVESNQNLSLIVAVLEELFADARYIWLVRNGMDMVGSAMQKQWYTGHSENHSRYEDCPPIERMWIDGRLRGDRLGLVPAEEWEAMERFEKICWYWGEINRTISKATSQMGTDKIKTVRLEDLSEQSGEVFQWLGLDAPARGETVANTAKSAPYHWTEWTPSQLEAFERHCGDIMDRFYPTWREVVKPENRIFYRPLLAANRASLARAEENTISSRVAGRIKRVSSWATKFGSGES